MRCRTWRIAAGLAAAILGACQNAGQDRALGVQATGVIEGLVYFDRDGNQVFDGADTILSGVTVHIIASGTQDTVATAKSSSVGLFALTNIPVGTMMVVVDTTTLPGDSIHLSHIDLPLIDVTPGDSFVVHIAASYPQMTVARARSAPLGTRLFVVAVALTPTGVFGDTTVRVADTTAAILLTRVVAPVAIGDSIRWLGAIATRRGEPTLDRPTAYVLGTLATPPSHVVATTAIAASASGGQLDAALVTLSAPILDTATVAGNRQLTANDGSGPLTVQLDASAGFQGSALASDTVGAQLTLTGVLAPAASGLTWILLPRAPSDIVPH